MPFIFVFILALCAANFVRVDASSAPEKNYPENMVSVISPPYCSDISGKTTIFIAAPGLSHVTAKCWKQGNGFGSDSTVGTVDLDGQGKGSIDFPADNYPHGPITVTLTGTKGNIKDNCYLQLHNKGGVSWNEGMPKDRPPAAKGMSLVFADDFNKMPTIGDGPNYTYYDHKPPHGVQDFSSIRFTSFEQPNNPFSHVGTYLRIRADANKNSSGLISSVGNSYTGITAKAPCYFECRFLGPNAIGAWPAFWLLSVGAPKGTDELDIIEAYGGEGPHEPNAYDTYMVTPHAWDQGSAGNAIADAAFKAMHDPIRMNNLGIPSTWYEAFHTYGVKITATDTIYYCDNIEVGRHKTLPISVHYPFFFLINLATGGGWPVNLSRYDGKVDMYVDYVRVWQGAPSADLGTP